MLFTLQTTKLIILQYFSGEGALDVSVNTSVFQMLHAIIYGLPSAPLSVQHMYPVLYDVVISASNMAWNAYYDGGGGAMRLRG